MKPDVRIYFATETGNSESLARRAYERALNEGWPTQLLNLSECRPAELVQPGFALFIVSTWGDGEPPSSAVAFFDDLKLVKDLSLNGVSHAVLGLGDSSYDLFNAFAKMLDQRLADLASERLMPVHEADVDFEGCYEQWSDQVFGLLEGLRSEAA